MHTISSDERRLLYEVFGDAVPNLGAVRVRWCGRPKQILCGETITCLLDVFLPNAWGAPVSNFCPTFLLPNVLRAYVMKVRGDLIESVNLHETTRVGRFALQLHLTEVGLYHLHLAYNKKAIWTAGFVVLDSWQACEKADIDGPALRAKTATSFFGQRVIRGSGCFVISCSDPCYVGVADEVFKNKAWSILVEEGVWIVTVEGPQLSVHQQGDKDTSTTNKMVRIDSTDVVPYVKLRAGQTISFVHPEQQEHP
ncbi:hypothetical protein GMRT_15367 [Giardia muris]|uniref:Uncharacterized protein n=1 Tax=Giardia muris TaxID=5742 RepID=A0A4Z1SZ29_GIAMU|nr:hypothetical protein GMRT_15367 [Giardia muris]|eukprot:TNJ30720.1 hypothetical protein GMRT_15367 [Giardia muris]